MISKRAYSRHRGCTLRAVQEAITAGRLRRCLVRDAKGAEKIADAALADEEWAATTRSDHRPLTGPGALAREGGRSGTGRPSELEGAIDSAARRLLSELGAWLGELDAHAEASAQTYARGAAEALQKKLGRSPTASELSDALLARSHLFWLEALTGGALAKLDGLPEGEREEMARLTGIEAVEEQSEAAHG